MLSLSICVGMNQSIKATTAAWLWRHSLTGAISHWRLHLVFFLEVRVPEAHLLSLRKVYRLSLTKSRVVSLRGFDVRTELHAMSEALFYQGSVFALPPLKYVTGTIQGLIKQDLLDRFHVLCSIFMKIMCRTYGTSCYGLLIQSYLCLSFFDRKSSGKECISLSRSLTNLLFCCLLFTLGAYLLFGRTAMYTWEAAWRSFVLRFLDKTLSI